MTNDSLEDIRKYYKVPATSGGKVEYDRLGVKHGGEIVGTESGRILVKFEGQPAKPFHPTWNIRYMEQNEKDDAQA